MPAVGERAGDESEESRFLGSCRGHPEHELPSDSAGSFSSEKKRAVDEATSQFLDVARENTNPIAA